MTRDSNQNPASARKRSKRPVKSETPPLNTGPGRPRSLDPDQRALDENIRRIYSAASIQSTLEETAATVGVSLDTLRAFFKKYPEVKDRFEDHRRTGVVSIRVQLFKNMNAGDAETARWLGERLAGIFDPQGQRELDLREKEVAARIEDLRLRREEADLRKQDLETRNKELELKNYQNGLPINIQMLSMEQLIQLRDRIMAYEEGGIRQITDDGDQPQAELNVCSGAKDG